MTSKIVVMFLMVGGVVFAQINVNTEALKQQAAQAAGNAEQQAYQKVRSEFKNRIADIPFAYNSAEIPLKEPRYTAQVYGDGV
ncbi:MAG: hypothetical protein ACK4TN_05670 [Brevinematales bacterium]